MRWDCKPLEARPLWPEKSVGHINAQAAEPYVKGLDQYSRKHHQISIPLLAYNTNDCNALAPSIAGVCYFILKRFFDGKKKFGRFNLCNCENPKQGYLLARLTLD